MTTLLLLWLSVMGCHLASALVGVPILRQPSALRSLAERGTEDALEAWARQARSQLWNRYGVENPAKQAQRRWGKYRRGTDAIGIELTDSFMDASYVAQVSVGTPSQILNVIMDTGSADFFLASSSCSPAQGCPPSVVPYDASSSSSFSNLTQDFSVTYGSGFASGSLAQDSVTWGIYTVTGATFAVCNTVDGMLRGGDTPISGLMGLGWQGLASSGATPVWQTLVESDAWSSPVFSFALRRWGNVPDASVSEHGGFLTLGGVNSSLYTGEINYVSTAPPQRYWQIPLQGLAVDGAEVDVGSPNVAIDTGTSLVGAPEQALVNLFAKIAGSRSLGNNSAYAGFWTVPCDSKPAITLQFGGVRYQMNIADFNLGRVNDAMGGGCLTSFFTIKQSVAGGKAIPAWIVGDAFLKNVYVSFRASPAAVGFAQLSSSFDTLSQTPKTMDGQTNQAAMSVSSSTMPRPSGGGGFAMAGSARKRPYLDRGGFASVVIMWLLAAWLA